jgi:drug/metabolite transporter (DMT)-like permease
MFMNLGSFVVIGLSWAILGEPIRGHHAVGTSALIAGVVLATRR